MYFIEILRKILNNKSMFNIILNKKLKKETDDSIENPESCEHLFVPIDKTNTIYACYKCGFIIKGKPKKEQ